MHTGLDGRVQERTQADYGLNEEPRKEEQRGKGREDGRGKLPHLTTGGTDTSCCFQLFNQIGILCLKTSGDYQSPGKLVTRRKVSVPRPT